MWRAVFHSRFIPAQSRLQAACGGGEAIERIYQPFHNIWCNGYVLALLRHAMRSSVVVAVNKRWHPPNTPSCTGVRNESLALRAEALGGTFHFVQFETSHMEGALSLIASLELHNGMNVMYVGRRCGTGSCAAPHLPFPASPATAQEEGHISTPNSWKSAWGCAWKPWTSWARWCRA